MINARPNYKQIARCVGLWLAEGDNKTNAEITFTNNCFDLVNLFHTTLKELYKIKDKKASIYVYTRDGKRIKLPSKETRVRFYKDQRASKPYYIWRVCSKELTRDWKKRVIKITKKKKNYQWILQGFFAGEGSVKVTTNNSRSISMSQSKRLDVIDEALNHFKIKYSFERQHRRGYIVQGRKNWDILKEIKIAELHSEKKHKFESAYESFKQYPYPRGYLKKAIIDNLENPITSKECAKVLERSQARVSETLTELKKEGKVKNFRVYSTDYWV